MPTMVEDLIATRTQAWVEVLQQLIRIPSTFGEEHAVLAFVEERTRALGWTPVRVPFGPELASMEGVQPPVLKTPGRYNVIVRVPGTRGGRSIALNSHLDVVPAGDPKAWTHPPFAGFVDPERKAIYGRGAWDDKAGVAIGLALLELLGKPGNEPPGDVVFQFVLEDETTGNGSLVCLEAGHVTDAALILDGTRPDRAIDQHSGQLQFSLSVRGLPAAVGVSHMGVNAAELLAGLLLHLRKTVFALNDGRGAPWSQFPSPNQFVTLEIATKGEPVTVPVEGRARCWVTFTPPRSTADMKRLLGETALAYARENKFPEPPVFIWDGLTTEPVHSPGSEFTNVLALCVEKRGMQPVGVTPSTGMSDLRHFAARGIPCLLYGPGRGYNPHRVDEHYFLDDLPRMVALLHDVINAWGSLPRR